MNSNFIFNLRIFSSFLLIFMILRWMLIFISYLFLLLIGDPYSTIIFFRHLYEADIVSLVYFKSAFKLVNLV